MTDTNSPRFIVARYLQDQGYSQTLEAFFSETDLPPSASEKNPGDWVLEEIIKEKSLYDQNLNFEKNAATTKSGWSEPSPSKPIQPPGANVANGLAVTADSSSNSIIASFVNSTVGIWDTARPPSSTLGIMATGKNILSLDVIPNRFFLSGQMDGSIALHELSTFRSLASIKAHANYAVQVISTWDNDALLIATAGWDKKLSIHAPKLLGDSGTYAIFPPTFLSIPTLHNVQSLLFARHPDTHALYLIYTVRDSIHLHYLLLSPPPSPISAEQFAYTATPSGRQSLAPQQHSTWASFTPAYIAACPTDPTLIAVATSHTPSMKLILTRLLFPDLSPPPPLQPPQQSNTTTTTNSSSTPTPRPNTQPHPQHATKDELAIKLVCNTSAPQNDYSTPRCAWRPDGSGVWVSGDDGVVRGIDAQTGKVVAELRGGHEAGTKVRGLWAGFVGGGGEGGDGDEDANGNEDGDSSADTGRREVCISAGFDRRVLVWEC